ncbi:MAG: ribosome maturation factor RimP [Clostridia bacterium]|jgi:ribosome maturation factor RimP|nr:ribosome maturation factor RimP [Clostridia bacterium]
MNFKPVEDLRVFLEKIAESMDIEIVEVDCDKRTETITVFIETSDGVDLDTCEKFHNAIMEPIDEIDPSYGAPYTLNVSSPGLDRPFKTERDFERNLGKEVEIRLYAPLKGKKFLEGVLTDYDKNAVTVKIGAEEIKLSFNKIAKINKAIKFD